MPNYGRDLDIGMPREEIKNVIVNEEVITNLKDVVSRLESVVEEQQKTQTALSFIEGEELDLEE